MPWPTALDFICAAFQSAEWLQTRYAIAPHRWTVRLACKVHIHSINEIVLLEDGKCVWREKLYSGARSATMRYTMHRARNHHVFSDRNFKKVRYNPPGVYWKCTDATLFYLHRVPKSVKRRDAQSYCTSDCACEEHNHSKSCIMTPNVASMV